MNPPRIRLALLVATITCVLGGIWWVANFSHRFSFLPARAPAQWILYPTPPETEMHNAFPAWTVFRRKFVITNGPGPRTLELRAFTDFQISINGQTAANSSPLRSSWKASEQFDVAPLLKPGTNSISVIVTNRAGPPALWAVLRGESGALVTDPSWEASLVGAVWQPAALAGAARTRQPGHLLLGGETCAKSFRQVGGFWILGLVAIGLAMKGWKQIVSGADFIFRRFVPPRRDWWIVAVVGLGWLLLLVNNLPQLPSLFGFDTDGHTQYIRLVQEQGRLPLANEGWQMYQPPLYYLLGAGLLELTGQSMNESATWLLRAFSGLIGLAHLIFLLLCLRQIFPGQRGVHALGLFFAASLPALLCVSQFITNEGLAAMLTTATLYFALRTLQSEVPSTTLWGATGVALGLALLSKFSAVVLLPFLFALLSWHAMRSKRNNSEPRWRGPLVTLAACAVVCGWHYARVWARFGNPLVGNWSPESGFAWWQENGYTSANYYGSFGRALIEPLFSGFDSLGDGLYTTLWADGLCSGGTKMTFRPPWNYSLMIAGLWLALVPSALVIVGAAKLVARWVRQATLEHLIWPALLGAYGLAIVAMTLRVPSYAQAKSVYALGALLPLCVCLLNGLETVRAGNRLLHRACIGLLSLWMLNAFASFWIRGGSAATHEVLATNLLDLGHPADALVETERALQLNPASAQAAGQRSAALRALGRVEEARQQATNASAQHGVAGGAWLELAFLAVAQGDYAAAAALARDAAAKLPDDPLATHDAAAWTLEAGNATQAETLCRRALRIRFANHALHFLLGKALVAQGRDDEALNHLRLAVELKPDWPTALNDLAWMMATHPNDSLRNGTEAVALAERACALTKHQQPLLIGTLAAAYAEAGRFEEAVRAAETAMQGAATAGLNEIVTHNEALLKLYRSNKPYHDSAPSPPRAPVKN